MAITAAMVKELREISGAGMMDCKKALTATEGDMDKAMEFLREKGLATAQKKAGRIAAEGLCRTLLINDDKKAVVVEVNAETDFVAKNEKFQEYVAQVAEQAAETSAADIEAFLAEPWKFDTSKTVSEALAGQIAVIGENMNIRRFQQMSEENGFIASYTHMGGKIGVLVEINCETDFVAKTDGFKAFAKDVAMHIAAANPTYVSKEEVPEAEVEHEKEILKHQALNEGKPEKIVDKMVEGRIGKFYKEICLLEQPFVKNPDITIEDLVKEQIMTIGENVKIRRFARFQLGEGIEKKQENFAEEVAAQMK